MNGYERHVRDMKRLGFAFLGVLLVFWAVIAYLFYEWGILYERGISKGVSSWGVVGLDIIAGVFVAAITLLTLGILYYDIFSPLFFHLKRIFTSHLHNVRKILS